MVIVETENRVVKVDAISKADVIRYTDYSDPPQRLPETEAILSITTVDVSPTEISTVRMSRRELVELIKYLDVLGWVTGIVEGRE